MSLGVKQRNYCNISELSTSEIFEWKVRAVINSPGEISGSLQFIFSDSELPETCSYGSLVYFIPIPDILLRDISSGSLFSKFIILWSRLTYATTVRCELMDDFLAITQTISQHMEKINCGEENKAAFQAVTLQGDRVAIYITGSNASKNVRLEYRASSPDLLRNFVSQTEVRTN